jgi:hypothetical protein
MFSLKKPQLVEIINKFSDIENKIDILNSKFESVKFMDGCCDCQDREKNIYSDINHFLDLKLDKIKEELLNKIHELNEENDSQHKLRDFINITLLKNKNEITDVLTLCCKDNKVLKSDINTLLNKQHEQIEQIQHQLKTLVETNTQQTKIHQLIQQNVQIQDQLKTKDEKQHIQNQIIQQQISKLLDINLTKTQFINDIRQLDQQLRKDLQQVVYNIKNDICSLFNTNILTSDNKTNINFNNANSKLDLIDDNLKSINNSLNNCVYDNQIIKHQFLLEDEMRTNNDDIESLKNLIHNIKKEIDYTLLENNFTSLHEKFKKHT